MATPLPFTLTLAPFPEGFQGDMDETFQQAYQNTTATVQGNFLTGLILPPGSTLPTSDIGPIAMNGTWYFWDANTHQYLPQASTTKGTRNYVRNSSYQVSQLAINYSGITGPIYPHADLAQFRTSQSTPVTIATGIVGPSFTPDTDYIPTALQYTSGPSTYPTLATTDFFAHEHLIEGIDIVMLQGQVLSLSFSVYASLIGTYSVYLANGARSTSLVVPFTVATANTWQRVKIAGIPALPTGAGWSYVEGQTGLYIGVAFGLGGQWQTANTNQWLSGIFMGTSQNINMLAAAANVFTITGVKLEAAAAPTYYQYNNFEDEYEAMQRYYYTNYNYQSTSVGATANGVCSAAAVGTLSWGFPRRMCNTPTVIPYSPQTNTAGTVRNLSTSADVSIATLTATRKAVSANGIAMTGATKSDVISALIRADARLS